MVNVLDCQSRDGGRIPARAEIYFWSRSIETILLEQKHRKLKNIGLIDNFLSETVFCNFVVLI